MKFSAFRRGREVFVSVKPHQGIDLWLYYTHEFENDAVAETMLLDLRSAMARRVAHLVRTAYAQGWKDAKARRKKRTMPTSCINNDSDTVVW